MGRGAWGRAERFACYPFGGQILSEKYYEEAFLFAKLMKRLSQDCALEVLYQERELWKSRNLH